MKSIFFGYTQTQSSAYYRMMCFAEEMFKQGRYKYFCNDYDPKKYASNVNLLEESLLREDRIEEMQRDLLFLIQKKKVKGAIFQAFSSAYGLALIDFFHHFKLPAYMELDDDPFNVNPDNPNAQAFAPGSTHLQIIAKQLELSDAIITTNEHLANQLRRYNKDIHIVPNRVDFTLWKPNKKKNKELIIGWEGGSGHKKDLELVFPAVKKILKKYKNVKFVFLGGDIPDDIAKLKGVEHIDQWCTIDDYPKLKRKLNFDIELAPMRDTLFNRSKSNLRYIEASALKTPTICSYVGPYKSNVSCLFATPDRWYDQIAFLIEHTYIRSKLGKDAYKHVKENYNLVDGAALYADTLDTLLKEHKKTMKIIEERRKKKNG